MAGVFYNTICGTDIYIYSIESSKKLKARVVTYTFSVNASDYTGPRLHLKTHARAFRRNAHMSTIIRNVGREICDLGEKRDKGDPFLASGSRFGTQEQIIFLGCPLNLLVYSRKTEYITLLQYSLIVPCSRFIEQSVTFC